MPTSLPINALLTTSAFAIPRKLGSTLAERVAAREVRHDNTLIPTTSTIKNLTSDISHVQSGSNWAGAVITSPPAGQKFTSVMGRFNAPTPSPPPGGSSSTLGASVWIGIDGYASNASLQSGIDFTISNTGTISYDAWFEWFPNFAVDFTGITISSGDIIQVAVTSTSSTTGIVLLQNLNTGRNVSTNVAAPSAFAALVGQDVEWIVEEPGSIISPVDFNTVTFTNCVASTGTSSVGTLGATIVEIGSSVANITHVTIPDNSTIIVTYI